jgi:DNA-binding IclR family transcriptional regulator
MDRRKLKRLFERSIADPALAADVRKIGRDWRSFAAALKRIRQQGHHLARGELDRGVVGIAAPVLGAGGDILGSLVVTVAARTTCADEEAALVALVMDGAAKLSARIAELDP